MTHKTRMRVFFAMIAASLILWPAETGYFGWHMNPQSHAKLVCDQIVTAIFFSVWLAFFVTGPALFIAINPFQRV